MLSSWLRHLAELKSAKYILKNRKGGWKTFEEVKPGQIRSVGVYLVHLISFLQGHESGFCLQLKDKLNIMLRVC